MKFVDQADVWVESGKGGDGCLSFRRERHIPKGGPDGGDGGDGGDVTLVADSALHTLADFRHKSEYKAQSGVSGKNKRQTGACGENLVISIPVGTRVFDQASGTVLGDLTHAGASLLVAKGGQGGFGNARFKSSVNRAPRRTTKGQPSERNLLSLELLLLADVGLIGHPNAGKSTLISVVSAARPKVASYPFTTLRPYLGVVRLSEGHSLVMADIPGLIKGAGKGAGLGFQFLKHAERAKLLLHLADLAPPDGSKPETIIRAIAEELESFGGSLGSKERWLVLTKSDLLTPDETEQRVLDTVGALAWQGPYYVISAVAGTGLQPLLRDLLVYMKKQDHSLLNAKAQA